MHINCVDSQNCTACAIPRIFSLNFISWRTNWQIVVVDAVHQKNAWDGTH